MFKGIGNGWQRQEDRNARESRIGGVKSDQGGAANEYKIVYS